MPGESEEKANLFFRFLMWLGRPVYRMLMYLGGFSIMTFQAAVAYMKPPYDWREVIVQMDYLGVRGLPIAIIAAVFTGGVLVLQLSYSLAGFGAKTFVGALVGVSLVRELGPVLTCLLVGGRVGAGITAELGSMQLAEQIDAMRSLGANPLKKLVAPRLLACVLVFPIMTALADFLGIVGGLLISMYQVHMESGFFLNNMRNYLDYSDIFSGIGKTFFFGYFVSVIGCFQGLNTTGGTEGLGLSTTTTVVISMVLILISDFFLTKFFMILPW